MNLPSLSLAGNLQIEVFGSLHPLGLKLRFIIIAPLIPNLVPEHHLSVVIVVESRVVCCTLIKIIASIMNHLVLNNSRDVGALELFYIIFERKHFAFETIILSWLFSNLRISKSAFYSLDAWQKCILVLIITRLVGLISLVVD